MSNTYLISFDPEKTDFVAMHKVIKTSPYISDWWHYLSSAYIVISSHPLSVLHNDVIERWPNSRFLIIEIDMKNRNGFLPENAWKWFQKYT